jgi:caa(3)-type oxidase subunit IV
MTAAASPQPHGNADHASVPHGEHIHSTSHYVKIWAALCVLLMISFAGPFLGIKVVTLLTAFGIALVKAYLVCAKFMHLDIEKRLASIIIAAALICMGLFFAGAGADVMKHEGDQWVNVAAKAETARRIEREGEHGDKLDKEIEERMHGGGHGGEHAEPGAEHAK